MKLIFIPVSVLTGLIAGVAARKVFERVWAVVDEEEPPAPDDREAPTLKLVLALALEGAIFRVAKGYADHGARRGLAALTGRWPGEEGPERA
jgi:uncharacterized protein DUF4235